MENVEVPKPDFTNFYKKVIAEEIQDMKKEYHLKGDYSSVDKDRKYQFKNLEPFKKKHIINYLFKTLEKPHLTFEINYVDKAVDTPSGEVIYKLPKVTFSYKGEAVIEVVGYFETFRLLILITLYKKFKTEELLKKIFFYYYWEDYFKRISAIVNNALMYYIID